MAKMYKVEGGSFALQYASIGDPIDSYYAQDELLSDESFFALFGSHDPMVAPPTGFHTKKRFFCTQSSDQLVMSAKPYWSTAYVLRIR